MKKILLSLAAASSLIAAVGPAAAQSYWDRGDNRQYDSRANGDRADSRPYENRGYGERDYGRGDQMAGRIQDLALRIDGAQRDGRISPVTAQHLRRQVYEFRQLVGYYTHDGVVTPSERATLERKYDYISRSITQLAQSGYRHDRYGGGYDGPDRRR